MSRRLRTPLGRTMLAAIALTLTVGVTACGDDGDDSSSSDATTTTVASSTPTDSADTPDDTGTTVAPDTDDPAIPAYCAAVQEAANSDDPSSQVEEIAAIAPAAIAEPSALVADYFTDPESTDREAALEAFAQLLKYNQDVCGIPIDLS